MIKMAILTLGKIEIPLVKFKKEYDKIQIYKKIERNWIINGF